MKKIRSVISATLAAIMILSLSFCTTPVPDDGKFTVVTTVFAAYDWVREISEGREVEIIYLLDNGVDMHNYKPTAGDIMKISSCDLFVHVGGASDGWVENALKNASNKDMKVINMMEVIGKDALAGVSCSEGEHHDHDHESESFDEHVWLSLSFADIVCGTICEEMTACDPDGTEIYKKNLEDYREELARLTGEALTGITSAKGDTLVFCDRFPFVYLTGELGLSYAAALPGCSTESSVSFDTVISLADKVDSLGISAILKIEGSSTSIADSVIATAKSENVKVLTLNSLQSVTKSATDEGITYLSVMRDNLSIILEALG